MDVVGQIRYTKLDRIGLGEGLNSEVYRATDPQIDGVVAVKEIPKSTFGDPSIYFDEAKRMFAARHENVVPIRYACETSDLVGLVMPHYARGSLAKRIAAQPLGLHELVRVADGVMRGVIRIHSAGSIHFDLKPSNVLFSDLDEPMVADFGQARQFNRATGTATPPRIYVPSFPPELLTASVATIHTDIYQLGLLLYRSVNSDVIFKAQIPPDRTLLGDRISRGKFPDRKIFLPHVPLRIRSLIRKALRLKPDERFGSVTDFAAALGRATIPLNWTTTVSSAGYMTWRAARAGQPDLLVSLEGDSLQWRVRTFTERPPAARRALGRKIFWREYSQRAEALAHLEDVFRTLETGA